MEAKERWEACYGDAGFPGRGHHLTWAPGCPLPRAPRAPGGGAPAESQGRLSASGRVAPGSWSLPLRRKPASGRGESLGIETLRPGFESAVTSLTARRGRVSQLPGLCDPLGTIWVSARTRLAQHAMAAMPAMPLTSVTTELRCPGVCLRRGEHDTVP